MATPGRLALTVSILLTFAMAAALIATPVAEAGPGQKSGSWQTLAPVPTRFLFSTGVEGMSAAVVGNQIIAALGFDSGDTDITRIYDIASDTWSIGASAPGASSEGAGAAHGGLFYNVGGRSAGANALWSYDPVSDAWTVLTPMPTARAGLAVAVVGNAIYAIGGRSGVSGPNSFGKLDVVERYDIDTGIWSTVASLIAPRSDLAAATVGGKIYVFGGFDAQGNVLGDVDVYNPKKDTWSSAPTDMPTARGAMYAVASRGGTVYVIGGWDKVIPGLTTNEAYKVSSDSWTTGLPPMGIGRAEASAVGHGGKIIVVGGATPGFGLSVDANEAFKP